jgi:hypothetical protein
MPESKLFHTETSIDSEGLNVEESRTGTKKIEITGSALEEL